MKNYKFSIIIPVAENENYNQTINAIKKLNYPSAKIEIIIVHGNQPSKQRNLASGQAKGDILYFLDNDSIPEKNNLEMIDKIFHAIKNAAVIGGPSLAKNSDTPFQKAIAVAFSSFIGSSFSRSRYAQIGTFRQSNELELILCNLAIRKDIFIKLNGFNTNLYPNEENELINRIQKIKKEIYYHPGIAIYRSHRKNIFKLIKQIFTYGRGRGEQTIIHISNLTLFPVISLGFDFYLILLLVFRYKYLTIPGMVYLCIIIMTALIKTTRHKEITCLFYLPVIYFIIHTFYGIGFISGIIKSLFKIKAKKEKFRHKIKWIKKIK